MFVNVWHTVLRLHSTPVQTVEQRSNKIQQQLPGLEPADCEDLTDLAAGTG